MERGERITFIKKLAGRLEDESSTDANLTLRVYGFPFEEFDGQYESWYDHLVSRLVQGSDAQLGELHRYLFPDEVTMEAADNAAGPWSAGTFRLFVSHTSAYPASAGRLSGELQPWGVDAFVAHSAIEPTREWEEVIESALRTCHAMCVLVTPDLVESRWCDQEVGFAMARRILIVPLKMGIDPHGFIGKYQAVAVSDKTKAYSVAHDIFDALSRSAITASLMAPAITRRFANSPSFENTRDVFPLLKTIGSGAWTGQMAEEVINAGNTNSQVRDAVLPGGRSAPEAAKELLAGVRDIVLPAPTPTRGDDDIPF